MELTTKQSWNKNYFLAIVKSFLIWSFTLTVCLLVVGFPLVVLMATIGVLMSVVLNSVMPVSSVLLVSGIIIGGNILAVVLGAAVLTIKGVNPQEVRWLSWLHGEAQPSHSPVYACCPLTCSVTH